jgi:hypothetical protein
MTAAQRILLTIRLELMRWIKDPIVWIGFTLWLFMVILGIRQHQQALPPRSPADRQFVYAYLLFALLALHSGIARDRTERFDAFLAANFLDSREAFLSRVGTLLIMIAGTGIVGLILGLLITLGDIEFGVWYATLMTCVALLFLPAIIITEIMFSTRYPIAIVQLLLTTAGMLLRHYGRMEQFMRLTALDVDRYDYADITQLLIRIAPAMLVTFALYPLYRWRIGTPWRRDLPM